MGGTGMGGTSQGGTGDSADSPGGSSGSLGKSGHTNSVVEGGSGVPAVEAMEPGGDGKRGGGNRCENGTGGWGR